MNSFWANLYDRYKDRRYAVVFVATLLVFFGAVVPASLLFLNLRPFWPPPVYLLPGIGLLVVAIVASIWRAIHRARTSRRPSRSSPLSRDEVRKARSKLKSSFKSFPAKAPDMDLKY